MAKRRITAVDICEVTGYNRDQLRGLLQKLPPYAERQGFPRVARTYSRHDMLVISVAIRLEQKQGLQRAAIATVIDQIQRELQGPRPVNPSPYLHISIDPPSVTYLTESQIETEGTVVALGPLFQQIDAYFEGDSSWRSPQASLSYGPSLATRQKQG